MAYGSRLISRMNVFPSDAMTIFSKLVALSLILSSTAFDDHCLLSKPTTQGLQVVTGLSKSPCFQIRQSHMEMPKVGKHQRANEALGWSCLVIFFLGGSPRTPLQIARRAPFLPRHTSRSVLFFPACPRNRGTVSVPRWETKRRPPQQQPGLKW